METKIACLLFTFSLWGLVSCKKNCSQNQFNAVEQAVFYAFREQVTFVDDSGKTVTLPIERNISQSSDYVSNMLFSKKGTCVSNGYVTMGGSNDLPGFKFYANGMKDDKGFRFLHFELSNTLFLKSESGFNLVSFNNEQAISVQSVGNVNVKGTTYYNVLEIRKDSNSNSNIFDIYRYLYSFDQGIIQFTYTKNNKNWTLIP